MHVTNGEEIYNYEHNTVCTVLLPRAVSILASYSIDLNYSECTSWLLDTDHNNDGYTNFREFFKFVYEIFLSERGRRKPSQVNCSACVGVDNYNPRHDSENYTAIRASDNVCWNGRDWSVATEYIFYAPLDGQISGVRLSWKSGWIRCNSGIRRTYFGCGDGAMTVQLVRIINERTLSGNTYYPRVNDTVHTYDAVLCQDANNPDDHGCEYVSYSMLPYVEPWEPIFEWIEPKYNVTQDMLFMLNDGVACCGINNDDNNGTSCAEVWFLYDMIDNKSENVQIKMSTTMSNNGGNLFLKSCTDIALVWMILYLDSCVY